MQRLQNTCKGRTEKQQCDVSQNKLRYLTVGPKQMSNSHSVLRSSIASILVVSFYPRLGRSGKFRHGTTENKLHNLFNQKLNAGKE